MKRFMVYAALMLLIAGMCIGKDRYGKAESVWIGASADSFVVPEYNGVAFSPDALDIFFYSGSGLKGCTLTMYIPLGAGPISKADSFYVYMNVNALDGQIFSYRGPISDTVRVKTAATCAAGLLFYQ